MTSQRDFDLVSDLVSGSGESSLVEFKHDNADPEMIGRLCSALANSARIEGHDQGYAVWGVADGSLEVVGTAFDPDTKRVGNQLFPLWLAQRLKPSVPFSFRTVMRSDRRLVLLESPAASSAPVCFNDIPYVRIGSATPKLTDFPERYQSLIEALRPYVWEKGVAIPYIAGDAVLSLLSWRSYFRLTNLSASEDRDAILDRLAADGLVRRDVAQKYDITNLGALLFGSDLRQFGVSIARKGVRVIAYRGDNRASSVLSRFDQTEGYAAGFETLIAAIDRALPQTEHIGPALRIEVSLFPALAIRELAANALIHQDLTIIGAGPMIEIFRDRVEITNPGKPLVNVDRMIDLPPRSRNEAMAALMRRMRICEEQGSGLDKVIVESERAGLAPPLFREEAASTQAILYGPRSFADLTPEERLRACYQHAVIRWLSGERMRNSSLCERLGIAQNNAAQASAVLRKAVGDGLIKAADPSHPRAGYVPIWA